MSPRTQGYCGSFQAISQQVPDELDTPTLRLKLDKFYSLSISDVLNLDLLSGFDSTEIICPAIQFPRNCLNPDVERL